MKDTWYVVSVMLAVGAVTFLIRALPFVASHWLQSHPFVHRLGRFLPLAIMVLLLLTAVTQSSGQHPRGPWLEAGAVAVVVGLQWFVRNPLVSIVASTGAYVLLRNFNLF